MLLDESVRLRVTDALRDLLGLTERHSQDEREYLLTYLGARRALALALRDSLAHHYSDSAALERMRAEFTIAARQAYPFLPEQLTSARRYGQTHTLIYNYLAAHLNDEVPAEELRVLTADAVHTERRARELRDIGLEVQAVDTPRGPGYRLISLRLNTTAAVPRAVRRNVEESDLLSPGVKQQFLSSLDA